MSSCTNNFKRFTRNQLLLYLLSSYKMSQYQLSTTYQLSYHTLLHIVIILATNCLNTNYHPTNCLNTNSLLSIVVVPSTNCRNTIHFPTNCRNTIRFPTNCRNTIHFPTNCASKVVCFLSRWQQPASSPHILPFFL